MHVRTIGQALGVSLLWGATTTWGVDLPEEVSTRLHHGVVQVWMGEAEKGEEQAKWLGSGSGSFINRKGLVITNDHVVEPGHGKSYQEKFQLRIATSVLKYKVVVDAGTEAEKEYKAEVLYQSESADLALLQVFDEDNEPLASPNCLRLFPSRHLAVGDPLWIFGFPGGDKMATRKDKHAQVTIDQGNIHKLPRTAGGRLPKIQTDLKGAPGNSGGPGVNPDGAIVGIATLLSTSLDSADGLEIQLVPADLIADLLKVAIGLGKVRTDTDLEPFTHLLVRRDGRVVLPGFDRESGQAVIRFTNGSEVKAQVLSKSLDFKTAIGPIQIPAQYAAYVVTGDETANLLIDGGDRLSAKAADVKLEFETPRRGATVQDMSNFRTVAFRDAGIKILSPDAEAVLFEGEGCRLVLTDIEGKVGFQEEGGKVIELGLSDIARIDTKAFKQVVSTTDGGMMTGHFVAHTLKAKLARANLPIDNLSLVNVRRATIEVINLARNGRARLTLAQRLAIEDDDLKQLAATIEAGQLTKAGDGLNQVVERDASKKNVPKPRQEQTKLLEAELLLRQSKYAESLQAFKKVRHANENVKWYADGRCELLAGYPDGLYQGRPLSDPAVFERAAAAMATAIVADSQARRSAYGSAMPDKHTEWKSLVKTIEDSETMLLRADSLDPGPAENEVFYNWRFCEKLTANEGQRLQDDLRDLDRKIEDFRSSKNASQTHERAEGLSAKRDKLRKSFTTLERFYEDLRNKMGEAGFRLDDPAAAEFLSQATASD